VLLLPNAREDRLTRFSVGSVFRQSTPAGFAPITRLVIERNRSTVEFYDLRRVRIEFGISRALQDCFRCVRDMDDLATASRCFSPVIAALAMRR
jgi:hypothetical protein